MRTFKQAWAEKEAAGYQYGRDALEQVRLGWDMRAAEAPAGLTRAQAVAILERTLAARTTPPGDGSPEACYVSGGRDLLRALIEAGAFTDGRNWGDRVPVQPEERPRPARTRDDILNGFDDAWWTDHPSPDVVVDSLISLGVIEVSR